ncbi:uncharacterized protein LOC132702236 [Cylas formicarius]|uniref:uncharacterized protein LOC132702236 n=1 Tax=Cylas formicarius TaxID=197179 RepID=UPI0029584C5F|nr:uncharacterized protein LOC132702236 [Cylas formicarius]
MYLIKRLYSTKYVKKLSKGDPGMHRRISALKVVPDEIEELDIETDFESDFMEVHKSYREHVNEMDAMKEQEKYFIVRQKYFKQKFPNFLTWHDKEQIKFLHEQDPQEWSVEKLSEGFPATREVVQSLVRRTWTKKTPQKIANHDKTVIKNWENFKKGNLALPQQLREHLSRFTERSLNLNLFAKPTEQGKRVVNISKPLAGEFEDIIRSYQNIKGNTKEENEDTGVSDKFLNATTDSKPKMHKKRIERLMTFEELQEDIKNTAKIGKQLTQEDRLLLNCSLKKQQEENIVEVKSEELSKILHNAKSSQANTGKVAVTQKSKDVSHLVYPDKIVIPKNIFKAGYTYKLNDCYYDSDGEFLYRVPGMG